MKLTKILFFAQDCMIIKYPFTMTNKFIPRTNELINLIYA